MKQSQEASRKKIRNEELGVRNGAAEPQFQISEFQISNYSVFSQPITYNL